MLSFILIKLNEEKAIYEFHPNASAEYGIIELDRKSNVAIVKEPLQGSEWHTVHALNKLEEYGSLKSFPKEERYALTSQLQRASTSVMFNIAEGFGRYSSKERIHFLDIANGSLMEVSSQIELAETYHYITTIQREEFDSQILSTVKQLVGLRKALLQSSNPSSPISK